MGESGRGAIGVVCLWLGGRVTSNIAGVDVLPLLGAIVGCHCGVLCLGCSVLWLVREGDLQMLRRPLH